MLAVLLGIVEGVQRLNTELPEIISPVSGLNVAQGAQKHI
jgi:hypothetical protein